MKKKIVFKLLAGAVCACLAVQSMTFADVTEVRAFEAQSEMDGAEGQDTDLLKDEKEEPKTEENDGLKDTGSNQDAAVPDKAEEDSQTGAGTEAERGDDAETESPGTPENPENPEPDEKVRISFEDTEKILIEIKKTKSKVNDDPFDGAFYYKGGNMRPVFYVYPITKVEDGEDITKIPEESIYKNEKGDVFKKGTALKKDTDYTVSYPEHCKDLGKYEFTVSAAAGSEEYEGSRNIPYEVVEKEHKWGDWIILKKPTVLKEGQKKRTCSICHKTENVVTAKIKPTVKLSMTTIPLKVKKTTTKFKVTGLAAGDYVTSYKSSNKKIFTVNSSGKIKAKKKGTAKLTVTLASGKKATAKVKVQKGTVKTTKVTVNTSSLVLLKGGKYTLRTSLTPLTTQQKVTYSSSNKKVATVSSKGVIKAKKKGTVSITVKSGSRKKKVSVRVQTRSFPNGEGNAFLKSCKKVANTIMKDGNWIYDTGSGTRKSLAEARASYRQTNCSNYVNFCMQDYGTLKPGMTFYSSYSAKIVYLGSASEKAATKEMLEQNYDIIDIGGKKALKAGLQLGDICLYKGHMNVYAGLNSAGAPMWYDAGRNSTSDEKAQSGYFTNMYRACYYNSLPIYIVLRQKK